MFLENFKSYAGRQKVGPFHKCFSSVVGPNGSGKSNVIDAMMFVFGKRAKQLRLNKVSELIHNSTNHQNLEMATVTVVFHEIVDLEGDAYDIVPGSELVIARTAHRNNTSNYFINGRKSNFTQVTDVLKGKGVDLDNNRFLILQGEVEQISMMKPKGQQPGDTGLLEYLEDIIGTDKYVEDIEKMSKMLEEMNERRQGMVSRVKIAEKERDSLEGAKLEAEQYLSLEREKLEQESIFYQIICRHAEVNMEKIGAGIEGLNERMAHEKEKLADYTDALRSLNDKYEEAKSETSKIVKSLELKRDTMKEFEQKDLKLQEDMKHLVAKKKKLTQKQTKDGAKTKTLLQEVQSLEQALPGLQESEKTTAAKLVDAETKLEGMHAEIKDEVEQYSQKLQQVRKELAPWEKDIQEVNSKKTVALAEKELLQSKHEAALRRAQEVREGAADARKASSAKEQAVAGMRTELEHKQQEVQGHAEKESHWKHRVADLEESLREVRGRVEHRRAAVSADASRGAVVKALLKAKADGQISGVYGRLGDLGAIDKKYDLAISSACGALDFIVVGTTAAAQRCVDLLRRQNLGVATFLILEKQQHLLRRMYDNKDAPEGVPRLFDLVRCDDEALLPAFYYALRDTVVATDLDQAGRIAYGQDRRWKRVVTVKGEVINESGTMTGGGGAPRGGRMTLGNRAPVQVNEKHAQADLRQDEEQLALGADELRTAQANVQQAAQELRTAQQDVRRLETAIPKAEMEASSLMAQAADLESRLSELDQAAQQNKEDGQRIGHLEKDIAQFEKEVAKLQSGCKGLSQKAGELQACINNAGGARLQAQKKLVETLSSESDKIGNEITTSGVKIASHQKQIAKLEKEVAKSDAEMEEIAAEVAQIEDALQLILEDASKLNDVLVEEEGVLKDAEKDMAVRKAELDHKNKEVATISTVQSDIEVKLEELRVKAKEQKKTAKHAARELATTNESLLEANPGGELPEPIRPEELDVMKSDDITFQIEVKKEQMLKMNPDMSALEKYREKTLEYNSRIHDLEAATQERDSVRNEFEALRKKRLDEFMSGFNTIGLKLKEMYQMITMGGDAELELVDSLDPFSEGIVFSVRPPRKSWKNISNLSGGEKTLSSLSLVFALHYFRPTPLYFMDEIDAALDFKNVSIVAHYIKERTRNAQFVIISLRNNMFELADRLVGIYKTENCTKSVAINPAAFVVGQTASDIPAPAAPTTTGSLPVH